MHECISAKRQPTKNTYTPKNALTTTSSTAPLTSFACAKRSCSRQRDDGRCPTHLQTNASSSKSVAISGGRKRIGASTPSSNWSVWAAGTDERAGPMFVRSRHCHTKKGSPSSSLMRPADPTHAERANEMTTRHSTEMCLICPTDRPTEMVRNCAPTCV